MGSQTISSASLVGIEQGRVPILVARAPAEGPRRHRGSDGHEVFYESSWMYFMTVALHLESCKLLYKYYF